MSKKYFIEETTLVDIADSVRALTGSTEPMTPGSIGTSLSQDGAIGKEVDEQADLIAQIQSAVDNLPEAGSSGGESDHTVEDSFMDGSITHYRNDRITYLKPYAFYEGVLELLTLSNCNEIGMYALSYTYNLSSINLPLCETINEGAFMGSGIEELYLPNCISITGFAFSDCTNLISVNLPACTQPGGQTFVSCLSLTRVNMSSVVYIYRDLFAYCENLVTLILGGNDYCELEDLSAFEGTPIMNGTGYIYVPRELLETYQNETNWCEIASQFRAIEDYPDICGWTEEV